MAVDDSTVGELINSATNSPGTNRYAFRALHLASTNAYDLHDLRFRNAATAVYPAQGSVTLAHSQIGQADYAIDTRFVPCKVQNTLIYDSAQAFRQASQGTAAVGEHLTVHRVGTLVDTVSSSYYPRLTNCLLISVTNNVTNFVGSSDVKVVANDTGIFTSVGAGTHYLANDGYRAPGSTTPNINPDLAAALKLRTTYPPILLPGPISNSYFLRPVALRDDDGTFDAGYHYDKLDAVVSQADLTNALLLVEKGAVLGVYGAYGLRLADGALLIMRGSATNLAAVVRYNMVQEQSVTNWSSTTAGRLITTVPWDPTPRHSVGLRFVLFAAPAGCLDHLYDPRVTAPDSAQFALRDCQLFGGALSTWSANLSLSNCLLHRVDLQILSSTSDVHNCTFVGGSWSVDGNFIEHHATDNIFDKTEFDPEAAGVVSDYNAYLTNFSRMSPTGSHDRILTNLSYETGPLGWVYLPTNSPLIDSGSVSDASLAALYHFCSGTNQVKETNSPLNLGFHFVALGTNGLPIDTDGDGWSDVDEDLTGDGTVWNIERNWQAYDSDRDYDGIRDLEDPNPDDPFNTKLVRLLYLRFNTNTYAGEAGELPAPSGFGPPLVASWSITAGDAYINPLRYRETEVCAQKTNANINLRNGTVRLWYKPDWVSQRLGGLGPQTTARLVEMGPYWPNITNETWVLCISSDGNTLSFTTVSNAVSKTCWSTEIAFTNTLWNQVALSYSPSNVALYLNGELTLINTRPTIIDPVTGTPTNFLLLDLRPASLLTNDVSYNVDSGIYNYPSAESRSWGFFVGAGLNLEMCKGQLEEFETFNYPLSAREIARDFPNFNGSTNVTADADYDGRSDLLEQQVDGTSYTSATSVVSNRLGYWRFNDAITNLVGERNQTPILTNQVTLTPSWSGNALVIATNSGSRIVYRDVEPNGWANFNCKQGAVRLWFKPSWSSGGNFDRGSFVAMGDTVDATHQGWWNLDVMAPGRDTLRFISTTNGVTTTSFMAPYTFTAGRWYQIAFNYGPTNMQLYVNAALITNLNTGVPSFPKVEDRANGLTIGNDVGGTRPLNGHFDELETFNCQLTSAEIQRSFQVIQAMDADLNGIPDLLEDRLLSASVPFTGAPFAVTGVFEAEQFDRGGKGVAYDTTALNFWTNDYRPSQIEITNCNDRGGGYCVNNLRSNEWLKFTLDVRVGQNYTVDSRIAGIGTGAVFRVEFYTNGASSPYTNTADLSITTTDWTNIEHRLLPLLAGINIMKVKVVKNSPGGAYAAKLNYISIYPSWIEGATNLVQDRTVTGLTADDGSWTVATNNAARIQLEIDSLTTNGTVHIPQGTYYVAQVGPDESHGADTNTAVFVTRSGIELRGAGRTNTTLMAHNRATTIFFIGEDGAQHATARTNITFADMTLEGRPHVVATNASGGTNWDSGALQTPNQDTGALLLSQGQNSSIRSVNILLTNCAFRNPGFCSVILESYNRNVAVRKCDFWDRDKGSAGTFSVGLISGNGLGIFQRPDGCPNLVVIENVFNGSVGTTNIYVNYPPMPDGGDGFVWAQGPGNVFVGRNAITNNLVEAVQLNAGPGAVAGNTFYTLLNNPTTTALYAHNGWPSVTLSNSDNVYSFVGNEVIGGRNGQSAGNQGGGSPYQLHFCGNSLDLSPTFSSRFDYPGAAVRSTWMAMANICGNTLTNGGHGVRWMDNCTNAIILKNDFARASFRALAYDGTNGAAQAMLVLSNKLGTGTSFHLRMRPQEAGSFFLWHNTYLSSNGVAAVNPFVDYPGAPVHLNP